MAMDIELLKTLSELPGAPGREERVREFIREQVQAHCDDVRVDSLGNLICLKRSTSKPTAHNDGEERAQRLMLACHMDEIAFYVRAIDDKGFIRVQHLGGFDPRNLFARRVRIQTRDGSEIIGNFNPGGRPVHIATPEDRKKVPEIKEFFVDTGLPVDALKAQVRPGDPVTLVQDFIQMGELCTGKSLDNRVACWVGIQILRQVKSTPYDLYVAFTAQEEIGVRGAITAAYAIDPDIGIAVDVTLAVDTPGVAEEDQVTQLGQGTAIKVMDSYSVSHKDLVDAFIDLAESREIPYQMEILPMGGTDAAALQRARSGSRAITLSVPTRYIHTVTETLHQNDLQATVDLLRHFIEDSDR